ncbi:MAG: extracellular solute-binding protein [Treponema sp.]|jgi:putative aldouronate transport system substrate-binding protein|nr:extracellular solute-binding protein [Treponema sp.]
MKVLKPALGMFLFFILIAPFTGCRKAKTGPGASGKPLSITVEVFDRGTDGGKTNPGNNAWTDWIKKKALEDENIAVTFVPVPRHEETQTLNNLMAAGSAPDICYTYSSELITHFSELGGLIDLTPYIDTLLKDYNAFLGMDPGIPGERLIYRYRDLHTGKMYMIPGRYMYTASQNLFIRKDWLDKLGLPLPTTKEEYYDALVAFREKDPGEVGKNRVIPFTMTIDVRWTVGIILDPFIDPYMSMKERWINTVIDRYILLPGYKEGFRFLNKMYNNGLIDRDFPLYKNDEPPANLLKSGMAGSFAHNWDHIYRENTRILEDLQKNFPDAELVPIDAIQSIDGITHKRGSPPTSLLWFVPKSAKNPEAAIRYANWLSRFENYNFLQMGHEGINHEMVNEIPAIKQVSGPWIQNSAGNGDYAFNLNGYDLGDPDLNARVLANSYGWPPEIITEAYRISSTNADPGPHIPAKLLAATPIQQTLTDKATVLYTAAVTAKPENFDQVWDDGVKDWLISGAQTIIDERREKYIEPGSINK